MPQIKKFIKHKLHLMSLFIHFLKGSIEQSLKSLPSGRKSIVFTLDDDRLYRDGDGSGRYAYLILNRFAEGGYNVYFYNNINPRGFAALREYGRLIYTIKNLKIIKVLPTNTEEMIYAFDCPKPELLKRKWKKLTYVNVLKPIDCKFGEVISIPYFMHPLMYPNKQPSLVGRFRQNEKKLRIVFGGNTTPNGYTFPDVKRYDQLTRFEAISALLESGGSIKTVENKERFYNLLDGENYINECYLLQNDRVGSTPITDWLNIVSKSDFFLCLSGTDLPMCHNGIEAMSVGTIPIISYPDWFFPSLEDGKNAVVYKGNDKEDMIAKIHMVLEMSPEKIAQMRQNVIEYYQKYLTTESFINRFEASNGTINTIMLHPRLIPNDQEIKDGNMFEDAKHRLKGYFSDRNAIKEFSYEEPFNNRIQFISSRTKVL